MHSVATTSLPSGEPGELLPRARQFLRFALGSEMQVVQIDQVREILEVGQMTPLPLMPQFVRGVMNLRGAVVPVIDLGARLGLPVTRIGRRTCVVLVDVSSNDDERLHTMGVLVDAVYEVFDALPDDAEPVPRLGTRIAPEFIRSMVRVRDQATTELDLGAVLAESALIDLIGQHTGVSAVA
jgi:purine-binding chemotaxis protein CheW